MALAYEGLSSVSVRSLSYMQAVCIDKLATELAPTLCPMPM